VDAPGEYEHLDHSTVPASISREIVRLHARLFGRGPTRAKTFLDRDYALCVLEDVLTRAEKTLVAAGNVEQVRATRRAFQEAVHDEFIEVIEEISGRTVRAFISEIHLDPELEVELFLFEPEMPAEPGEAGQQEGIPDG
jgi:uncharacterized protein YbcI